MSKPKKTPKPRSPKYDTKIKVNTSFENLIKIALQPKKANEGLPKK